MRKVWIVVANSSSAKIYQAENTQKMIEKKSLEHFESHLKDEDLLSDKEGRTTFAFNYGPHPYQEKTPQKVKERHAFAEQIADYLEEGHKSGEFEHLHLIANPTFLGFLRASLSTHVTKTIVTEIHKDLTHEKPEEIRKYLPPVL